MISLGNIIGNLLLTNEGKNIDAFELLTLCNGEYDTPIVISEVPKKKVTFKGGVKAPTFNVPYYKPSTTCSLRDKLKAMEAKMPQKEKYVSANTLSGGALRTYEREQPKYNMYPYVITAIF